MITHNKNHPIIQELEFLIKENNWENEFKVAISNAHKTKIKSFSKINNLSKYLEWINTFLYWIPEENSKGTFIYDYLGAFYFIFNQKSLLQLQNEIIPNDKAPKLTILSEWLVKYTN
ncbi:MAG: hypothetical protein NTW25_03895 [Candidatus Kapabacteria bacterium]|nr:hypothetical protein [Candidatus Kapabacteria bacterium]